MIPEPSITAWAVTRPWPSRPAIEQDLLLARTIVAIYEHPYLREELAFRGGTCLHQVHLPTPRRYSEDLDFVRCSRSGVGAVLDGLREVGDQVGLEVRGTKISQHPKLTLRGRSETYPNPPLRIKVEINTHETSPAQPLIRLPFAVTNSWFTGTANVLTFDPAELVATKLRALYQRKKGRDLFDLWLALSEMKLPPNGILAAFHPYRPDGYTAARAIANLNAKINDPAFRSDLNPLVGNWPNGYDIRSAADLVQKKLLAHL